MHFDAPSRTHYWYKCVAGVSVLKLYPWLTTKTKAFFFSILMRKMVFDLSICRFVIEFLENGERLDCKLLDDWRAIPNRNEFECNRTICDAAKTVVESVDAVVTPWLWWMQTMRMDVLMLVANLPPVGQRPVHHQSLQAIGVLISFLNWFFAWFCFLFLFWAEFSNRTLQFTTTIRLFSGEIVYFEQLPAVSWDGFKAFHTNLLSLLDGDAVPDADGVVCADDWASLVGLLAMLPLSEWLDCGECCEWLVWNMYWWSPSRNWRVRLDGLRARFVRGYGVPRVPWTGSDRFCWWQNVCSYRFVKEFGQE